MWRIASLIMAAAIGLGYAEMTSRGLETDANIIRSIAP